MPEDSIEKACREWLLRREYAHMAFESEVSDLAAFVREQRREGAREMRELAAKMADGYGFAAPANAIRRLPDKPEAK